MGTLLPRSQSDKELLRVVLDQKRWNLEVQVVTSSAADDFPEATKDTQSKL
jgi:hypothetical protein